ncbi:putative membrane protein [Bacteroides fragilis str. 3725 D9(v)]|nr:putative membrane protein [Bacteroides fragilis str. 3725 D9(v)]
MLYTLINMIVGEKIPFFVSGVFFIAFMLYLGYTVRYLL